MQIFSLSSLEWRAGPEFPGHLVEGAYAQYASSFITVGGFDVEEDRYSDQIYLYDPDNAAWVHFSQTLAVARTGAVAIMVPDDFCPGGHEP